MSVENPRLARPRKDVGKWGAITNKFLRVAHNEDGTLKHVFGGGYDYLIWTDEEYTIYVQNRTGEIVYGGPDAIGVSDSTDFGEILQTTVNNHGDACAIRIAPGAGDYGLYLMKSPAILNYSISLYGPGRNRIQILSQPSVTGEKAIEIKPAPGEEPILRIDSVKFYGYNYEPDIWLYTENLSEIIITNVEFRDAQSWGIYAKDSGSFNTIRNSWFLADTGIFMSGDGDIDLQGNKLRGINLTLEDFPSVILANNYITGGSQQFNNIGTFNSIGNHGYPNSLTEAVTTDESYQVGGTQVVSSQGAAVADATDAATTMARLNDLLARCRAHGLIAT